MCTWSWDELRHYSLCPLSGTLTYLNVFLHKVLLLLALGTVAEVGWLMSLLLVLFTRLC